jgi:hypothetical protein
VILAAASRSTLAISPTLVFGEQSLSRDIPALFMISMLPMYVDGSNGEK